MALERSVLKDKDRYTQITYDNNGSKCSQIDRADPRAGVRLIKAFLEISDPTLREKLIRVAEDLAKGSIRLP